MTRRDWMTAALKTMGVVLVIVYLSNLFTVAGMVMMGVSGESRPDAAGVFQAVMAVVGVGCGLFLGLLLVSDGGGLADRLLRTMDDDEADSPGQRALFAVALRVIGVVCLVRALPELLLRIGSTPVLAQFMSFERNLAFWIRRISWPIVLLAIGLYLVLDGKALMHLAYGKASADSAGPKPLSWKPATLFSVALRVLGVGLLTGQLPRLIDVLVIRVFPLTADMMNRSRRGPTPFDWPKFLGGLFVLVISIYLVTGARGLVRKLFKDETPSPDAEETHA